MKLTLKQARQQIEDRELWLWRQENWHPHGENLVGDHDEDYVLDALFDIPNRY